MDIVTSSEDTHLKMNDMARLNVLGTIMYVMRSTLCAGPPTSILRRMFDVSTETDWRPRFCQETNAYIIDQDAKIFGMLIDVLRYGNDIVHYIALNCTICGACRRWPTFLCFMNYTSYASSMWIGQN